jgi:hypothetical protein
MKSHSQLFRNIEKVLLELMRSNRVVRPSDMVNANANVAKVIGSIPALSSDTVEPGGRQMKQWLKGQCHEIFDFCFFHESVSPQPLSIPIGPFRIFSKIRGGIRSSRCTTGVADTGGKWQKSSN